MKEEFPEIDALLDYISEFEERHKNTPMLLDPVQFLNFKNCYDALTEIITSEGSKIETKITMNWFGTGSCSFSIETDDFTVREPQKFIDAIKHIANFEVYPLLNGNIKIGVMFNDVMRPV